MDYVTARIALGGDQQQVLYRGPDRPVSWPEVILLQFLHGDENVWDCNFVRTENTSIQQEKARLVSIYGKDPVELVFPGSRPHIDGTFPGDKEPVAQKRPEKKFPPNKQERNTQVEI